MEQPTLWTSPPAKQVRDTSIAVYREIAPSVPRREQAVLDALSMFAVPTTAYELFGYMRYHRTAFDLNSVRPRLTALLARHCVERCAKRPCRITGRTVYTWRAVIGHPPVLTRRKAVI